MKRVQVVNVIYVRNKRLYLLMDDNIYFAFTSKPYEL